ncbi:MAG: hypothetical protein RR840_04840 [Clostridium sp.]
MISNYTKNLIMARIIAVTLVITVVFGVLVYLDFKKYESKVVMETTKDRVSIDMPRNLNGIKYIDDNRIKEVTVSSFKKDENFYYTADKLIDNNKYTPWIEGKKGYGEKEWLKLQFKSDLPVKGIVIDAGYNFRNDPYGSSYKRYSRPKTIKIGTASGSHSVVSLRDMPSGENIIKFKKKIDTDYVLVEILEVYPGTEYDDTCISQLKIF